MICFTYTYKNISFTWYLYRAISVSEEFNLSFIIYAFDAVIITQEATMTTNRGRHIYAPVFIIT